MRYNKKDIEKLKSLQFNKDANVPNLEHSKYYELDPSKIYLVEVETVETSMEDVSMFCSDLRDKLTTLGIKNILIVPTCCGTPLIKFYELEPTKE